MLQEDDCGNVRKARDKSLARTDDLADFDSLDEATTATSYLGFQTGT